MTGRTASKRLTAAMLVSVAAHAALISGEWLPLPATPPEPEPLTVRLEPLPPPPPAPAPAPPVAKPRPPAEQPRRIAIAPKPPQPSAAAEVPVFTEPAIQPVPEAAPAAAAEPAVLASAEPTTFRMPEPPPLPSFPRRGSITYLLTMGPDQTPVGRTVQTWEFEGDQYQLGSQSESTGLIEMFRPHRYHYLSKGTVSDQGLRPDRFLASVKRGSRSEESLVQFNWDEHRVRLGRVPQQTTVPLPDGSQDVISFMYHLALAPPVPGRIRFPFTRGSRLEMVSFDVQPHEMIETPLGRLRTVPVVQVREPGSESLAIWLATEYRNLPVRIRFYNRDGETSGEQLVSEIRVSEQ